MNFRRASYFLVSLLLTSGIALAQQATSGPGQGPPRPPEGPDEPPEAFSLFVGGGSFLGVYAEDIGKENMSRYGLREPKGVAITGVVKDSPAEKAGLKKDDVILRFDNENVTSVRKLNRLVSEVAPDQTARVAISRGGSEREVTVTVGKREGQENMMQGLRALRRVMPEGPNMWKWEEAAPDHEGFVFAFGNNRRIGISTMQLTKQLADYFGVTDGRGVLVTSVADDSPAAKAGIKAGDVITAADGEKVEGAGDLSRTINKKKEGDVNLTIIRNKSQQSVTVTPKEGDSFPGVAPRAGRQIGRRVIVPRIELPVIPEMDIRTPRIELPVIPEIEVYLPRIAPVRVRRSPRVI
ncbi:MAG TPA: PDZ domain-containing protein [Pyrinomonadaceae bacterium]|nr:PDZ domain-containing protein [Pyrinomonadaceae bacterium]